MALPSEEVVLLASAYWQILNREGDPAEAQRIFRQRHRNASPQQLTAAIGQVQRGLETTERLNALPVENRIRDALWGQNPPAPRVGVRVDVTRTLQGGQQRTNTVFIDARWEWTVDQLLDQVADWVESTYGPSGEPVNVSMAVSGFTRFPLTYQQ